MDFEQRKKEFINKLRSSNLFIHSSYVHETSNSAIVRIVSPGIINEKLTEQYQLRFNPKNNITVFSVIRDYAMLRAMLQEPRPMAVQIILFENDKETRRTSAYADGDVEYIVRDGENLKKDEKELKVSLYSSIKRHLDMTSGLFKTL
jgi:hypothetical protein